MTSNIVRTVGSGVLSVLVCVSLLGCGSSASQTHEEKIATPRVGLSMEDSRYHFLRERSYASLEELTDDSPLIVVGKVEQQETALDVDNYHYVTLSTVNVISTLKGKPATEGSITVRQTGENDPIILKQNEVIMLFLNPVADPNRPEDKAVFGDQYAVRGVTAGIYSLSNKRTFTTLMRTTSNNNRSDSSVSFERMFNTEIDQLPDEVDISQVLSTIQQH
ncbi:hypothetical protein AEAE_0990 [Aeriscardovia aeriphila]|uniref:Lipoprotein n=2 Tax=Aeriscardovia aeriphila TaxID=218139 RepID=A0A261FBJ9_9BIFI|nr:hypothetical protein AEAE_0990 [Aeriscardovia aeriphila]